MDHVRLKIQPQSNGNHIRNTLRFLYWLSRGIILYLLRNSSGTRDKCKLKLFLLFFVKPCTTPTFSLISLLTSFFFYCTLKIFHQLTAFYFTLIFHPFPSHLSHHTFFFQILFKFVSKRRNGRALVFSLLFY